jgi:hypothetical protein
MLLKTKVTIFITPSIIVSHYHENFKSVQYTGGHRRVNTEGPTASSHYSRIPNIGMNRQDEAEEEDDEELNSSLEEVDWKNKKE